MIDLILTIDYEIFGNGDGCPERCIIDPANRMLEVADEYNASITFFAEVAELMAMESLGKASICRIKKQIMNIAKMGHDVQLHIHPQWLDECRTLESGYILGKKWRIGDYDYKSVLHMVKKCKDWLERIINIPDYKCIAFRAGGWGIQPSSNTLRALNDTNIYIDSSVAPGMKCDGESDWYDFRTTPDRPFWHCDDDVCTNSESAEICEVPIVTGDLGRLRHLREIINARSNVDRGLAAGCIGSYAVESDKTMHVIKKLKRLQSLGKSMLDVCTLSHVSMIKITEDWIGRYHGEVGALPIVAIGHTKNFTKRSARNLSLYLEWAKGKNINFSSFGEWYSSVHGQK